VSSSSTLILVIGILIATLLVIAGFVIPIFITGGGRSRPRPRARRLADSPANYLIMGAAYLFPPLDFTRSRGSVQRHLERAIQRVDVVDPYAAPRRIGSALLQAGFVDSQTSLPPAAEPEEPWAPGEPESLWSSGGSEPESIWSSAEPESTSPPAQAQADLPPQPADAGPIWAHAEPDAEFGPNTAEPEGQKFDRLGNEQSRDYE
jgi:hypothetical protein